MFVRDSIERLRLFRGPNGYRTTGDSRLVPEAPMEPCVVRQPQSIPLPFQIDAGTECMNLTDA